jgi:hypothetical protein
MRHAILSPLIQLVLPLIVGAFVYKLTEVLKGAVTAISNMSATKKQAVVVTLSALLAVAVKFFGDYLPGVCVLGDDPVTCLTALTEPSALKILLTAIVATVIHSVKAKDEANARGLFRR